jgi:N utilization substance protein A
MMILQKIKATKNQNIISEYQNKIGHVVTGIVSGFDKGSIIFTVNGNIDMIIPQNEKIFNEKYKIGDTISGVIIRINEKQRYSPIIVSRADELFVEELMRQEIPEINEGKVKIIKLKRYPGFRTKVIVKSEDSKLDAIGACVGRNGLRIKNIMNEFQRERLDLIRYSENVVDIVKEALVPINVMDVRIDEVYDTVTVYVDGNAHRSLLKKHNKTLLLTSKLIGRKVIAETYLENSSFEAIKDNAIKNISDMLDISMIEAMSVVNSGYTSIECIVEEDLETFIANCGLGEVTASGIHAAATAIVEHLENQEA